MYHSDRNFRRRVKRAFWDLERRLSRWYWGLKTLPRRIVGWLLVIGFLVGVWIAGSYIFKGCSYVCSEIGDWWSSEEVPATEAGIGDYSGSYKHREFITGEKNPKRSVNLSRDFNDINATHLQAARKLGIPPQPNRDALMQMTDRLVALEETRYYCLDPMTQSVPYLVPDAADFLTALGKLWQEYHGTNSRYIITSCTRSDADVRSLKKSNVNATEDSAHRYGTTIDITYNRYDRKGNTTDGKLKEDLARALYDMQQAGHCYVKYEYKQACFHITVRPK